MPPCPVCLPQVLDLAKSALRDATVELADNPAEACFVVTCAQDVVGVLTLSRKLVSPEDIEWVRANYQVDFTSPSWQWQRASACRRPHSDTT
jgi:hypothetical protein